MIRKTLLIFLVALSASLTSSAQDISLSNKSGKKNVYVPEKKTNLDTELFEAHYRMFYVKDVKKPEKKRNYFMSLQIGKKISKFSDYYRLKTDSIGEASAKLGKSEDDVYGRITPIFMGTSALNVFKNYPTNKITVADRVFLSGNFKYEETKEKPHWTLKNGFKIICGYKCKKATTTFRGRYYTAWYAPKIAFSDGPWKFWGLPGLILKVSDSKKEFLFECVGIQKAKKNKPIYIKKKDYYITSRKKFNELQKRAYGNPKMAMETNGITLKGKNSLGKKSRPFNPIELE